MVFTKRERLALLAALLVLALFAGDYFVFTPFMNYRDHVKTDLATVDLKLKDAQRLLNTQRRLDKEWKSMLLAGVNATPSEAESRVLHSVRDWAQESGLLLVSLKPEHTLAAKESRLQEIAFRASGTGTMAAVARMVWCLESATTPIHVNSLNITPRKEATDDLSIQLSISTICLNPEPEKLKPAPLPKQEEPE